MIQYSSNVELLETLDLNGFFVGWPSQPSSENFTKILKSSYKVVIAFEEGKLIGFINSISDGILCSYIPLLEVLPDYQKQGIGKELIKRMLEEMQRMVLTTS